MTDQQSHLKHRLNRFRDCHLGKRLVLVCNGPSLNQTDFSPIRKEVSMGLNKIYLGFKKFRFYPRYYVAINRRVIEQSAVEIQGLNCIRFLRDLGTHNPLADSALTYLLSSRPEQRFYEDLCKGFFEGYTVTFTALQIAFFMGFTAVAIVGMDHRYSFEGAPISTPATSAATPGTTLIWPIPSASTPWPGKPSKPPAAASSIARWMGPALCLKRAGLRRC
jgi:hypothetical protein